MSKSGLHIEECPICMGMDPDCPECEGCGEVARLSPARVAELDKGLRRAGLTDSELSGRLTPAQTARFIELAIGYSFRLSELRVVRIRPLADVVEQGGGNGEGAL